MSEQPRTQAGQKLLDDYYGGGIEYSMEARIAAIEREAVTQFRHRFIGAADTTCYDVCGLPPEHPVHDQGEGYVELEAAKAAALQRLHNYQEQVERWAERDKREGA